MTKRVPAIPALVVAMAVAACHPPSRELPDIALIVVDTLRSDRLASYGHPVETAPTLTRLAREGVVFEHVVAASSFTKTSVASLMASRDPHRHGVRDDDDAMPEGSTLLAQPLSAAGYRTIGINTNPWLSRRFGFAKGFDVYRGRGFAEADEVNERALAALADLDPDTPLFLYVHYMDVHAPYVPAAEWSRPDGDSAFERRYRKEGLDGPGVRERVLALYDDGIRRTDAAIGALLGGLRDAGRLERGIVLVTSDHGEAFREHGFTEHGRTLYPEEIRVPWIVHAPGRLPPGRRVTALARTIDIAPTLLALVGVEPPLSFEGASLLPLDAADGRDRVARAAVGGQGNNPDRDSAAVVTPEFLYLHERTTGRVELYDLRSDPGAQRDLAPGHPRLAELAALEGRPGGAPPAEVELDEAMREHLRALGYVEAAEAAP